MDPIMEAEAINRELEKLYSSTLPEWKSLHFSYEKENRILSIPSFLKVSASYLSASPRIVFVGQETHGWFTKYEKNKADISAGEIMEFYEYEWLVLFEKYKGSPYWRAMRHVAEAFNLAQPPRSFLYSNIFPCDLDKKRAPDVLLEGFRNWKILPEELRVLAPDYVVFFCGPGYCYNLERYFGVGPSPSPSSKEPLVRYRPQDNSWTGFVTYHPNYLQRSKRRDCLDKIIDFIKEDMISRSQSSGLAMPSDSFAAEM